MTDGKKGALCYLWTHHVVEQWVFQKSSMGAEKNIRDKGICILCTHSWFSSVYWSHSCRRPVHVHAALPISLCPGLTSSWVPAPVAFALVTGACSAHMWKKGQKCQRINTPTPCSLLPRRDNSEHMLRVLHRPQGSPAGWHSSCPQW